LLGLGNPVFVSRTATLASVPKLTGRAEVKT
jgi:hypothetical protein